MAEERVSSIFFDKCAAMGFLHQQKLLRARVWRAWVSARYESKIRHSTELTDQRLEVLQHSAKKQRKGKMKKMKLHVQLHVQKQTVPPKWEIYVPGCKVNQTVHKHGLRMRKVNSIRK